MRTQKRVERQPPQKQQNNEKVKKKMNYERGEIKERNGRKWRKKAKDKQNEKYLKKEMIKEDK